MQYISSELTHFVGRSLQSDAERYALLCRIIRGGVLLDPSHVGKRYPVFRAVFGQGTPDEDGVEYSSYPSVHHGIAAVLSDNALLQFEIVCFCDIPIEALSIHCTKYGHFGLALSKEFLVAQGASPVMYIPSPGTFDMTLREHHSKSGKLQYEQSKTGSRAQLIDQTFTYHNFLCYARHKILEDAFPSAESSAKAMEVVKELRTLLFYQTAVEAFIFGHLKFFNPELPADHDENYYMEREWRVAGKVRFSLADLQRVFVSSAFEDQLRRDLPELANRVVTLSP